MAIDRTKVLLFSVEEYDRWDQLEDLDDNELLELAAEDDENVMKYSLKEFQQECNDEAIDLNGWWIYFVKA